MRLRFSARLVGHRRGQELGPGGRLALLFYLGQTQKLCTLFSAPSLAFLPSLSPILISQAVLLPGGGGGGGGASVCAAYLGTHFSVSQSRALRDGAGGCLSGLHRSACTEESHLSFCSPFSSAGLLAAAYGLSPSAVAGPNRIACPMLRHLPCPGMDFLLRIFDLSWSLHFFSSVWRASSIIPIHGMGEISTLLLPSGLSLSPPASQSFLSASFCPVCSSFWNLIPFSLLARPVSALDGLHLIKFCSCLGPFRMGLTGPGRAYGRSCLMLISRGLLALSGIPSFFHGLVSADLPPCFARWTQSFLFVGALEWFITIAGSFLSGGSGCSAGICSWP